MRHSDITWFDENFLAALRQLLPDVRSMFGFGSGRGDFERYFYDQVHLCCTLLPLLPSTLESIEAECSIVHAFVMRCVLQ